MAMIAVRDDKITLLVSNEEWWEGFHGNRQAGEMANGVFPGVEGFAKGHIGFGTAAAPEAPERHGERAAPMARFETQSSREFGIATWSAQVFMHPLFEDARVGGATSGSKVERIGVHGVAA